ncbi:MAG: nucleotidyltransferase family protein [Bacillota bacterium]|nr:nucleotidyltransferase family protein [Bacillota bacterium]
MLNNFDELKNEDLNLLVRYEKQLKVLDDIRALFGAAKIEFVALKGAVIRNLYDQPWQRRSADVDILIKPEKLQRARSVLIEGGYKSFEKNSQHMVFYSPSRVMLEVHFTLCDYKRLPKGTLILENIWEKGCIRASSTAMTGFGESEYVMTDEYFYFFHIYHLAKHLISGGVKQRDVYDTFLLNTKIKFDKTKRDELLINGGLKKVADELYKMANVMYAKPENSPSEDTEYNKALEYYISHPELAYAANLAFEERNSRFKYLLTRLFPPFDLQKKAYPYVEKCPFLLPLSWLQRGYNLLTHGYAKKMKSMTSGTTSAKKEDVEKLKNLFSDLELI